MTRDVFDAAVLKGGLRNLEIILAERMKRLGDLSKKMKYSVQWLETNNGSPDHIESQKRFRSVWPDIRMSLEKDEIEQDFQTLEQFKAGLSINENYIKTIQSLEPAVRDAGRSWQQSIVDGIEKLWR